MSSSLFIWKFHSTKLVFFFSFFLFINSCYRFSEHTMVGLLIIRNQWRPFCLNSTLNDLFTCATRVWIEWAISHVQTSYVQTSHAQISHVQSQYVQIARAGYTRANHTQCSHFVECLILPSYNDFSSSFDR